MITLSYNDLNNRDMRDAMEQIDNCKVLSNKTASSFNKIKCSYDSERAVAGALLKEVLAKWQKSKIMVSLANQATDKTAMVGEVDALMATTFTIEATPISAEDLASCQLSSKQLRALAPILSDGLRLV